MLDEDLAMLYQVKTMVLNQSVKRNSDRFPKKFCFKLTQVEYDELRSQIVTSNLISQFVISKKHGGRRKLPFAFTEQGVAMLSGVLKSKVAIRISIQIMSEFVSMRKMVQANTQLFARMDNIEQKQILDKNETDKKFSQVFDALANKDSIPKQKLYFEGQIFDAYLFVSKLIRSAKKEIVLIDNFVDENVLLLLTKRKLTVAATIYSKNISSALSLDLKKHNSQYPNITLKKLSAAHDRFLIIDNQSIYLFGASIKDLGKKWCAVSRLEVDTLELLQRLPSVNSETRVDSTVS